MGRVRQQVARRPAFNDPAGVHDGCLIGDFTDHADVMRNENQAHVAFVLLFFEQFENLSLYRDIERRRRFVGNQHFRVQCQCHRYDDALPHSPGKLVGVVVHSAGGAGDAHSVHHLDGGQSGCPTRHSTVDAVQLANLIADRVHRIERGQRVLEHHADFAADDALALLFR